MASDLPFDLWFEILSYLPSNDRRRLYSINHAIFEIAMDERYRELRFKDGRQILINLELLS